MKSRTMLLMALLLCIPTPTTAQLTCADVEWDAEVLSNYPPVAEACLEMVERGGEWYARLRARVLRTGHESIVVQYAHNDNSWGAPQEVTPPEGFRVMTDEGLLELRDLQLNEELNVYLREGRWELAMSNMAEPEIDPAMLVPLPHTEPTEPIEPVEAVPPPEPASTPEQAAPDDAESSSSPWRWVLIAAVLLALLMFLRRRRD
jgi:hypothetical protein